MKTRHLLVSLIALVAILIASCSELQAVDVNEGEVIFAVCLPVKYILGIIV